VISVVFPTEPDVTVTVIDQPVIREGDTVCVATEIVEYRLRAGEGPLCIYDPAGGSQLTEKTDERAAIGQPQRRSWPSSRIASSLIRVLNSKTDELLDIAI
jgi:hypothetical protein